MSLQISKIEQKEEILQRTLEKIDKMPIEDICKGVPVELKNLLTKCRQMEYEDKPDYLFFLRSMKKIMMRNGIESETLDWHRNSNKRLIRTKEFHKDGLDFKTRREE